MIDKMFKRLFGLCLMIATVKAMEVFPLQLPQGYCFTLKLVSTANITNAEIYFDQKKHPLHALEENRYLALIATDYDTPTGDAVITVKLPAQPQQKIKVKILDGNFKGSTVTVTQEKKSQGVTDWRNLATENKILGDAYRKCSPQKYWQGVFRHPLDNFLYRTTPYGAYRRYENENQQLISTWRHRGIDFAAHLGTFVYAPNDGLVTVSKHLQVHGKTIVIDHGLGVQSAFNHLSQRFVRPRQYVKKGQCIGRVGNTGLSTGAHLHYGISVNNKRVNPDQWLEQAF